MEKQKKINTLVISGLIIVIGAMTIGFAALSQRLDIKGTATVKSSESSWNVYFSDVSKNELVNNASWTTAPEISTVTDDTNKGSNNTITFACELTSPGDACTVTATVKNGGTTKAKYLGYSLNVDGANKETNTVTLDTGVVVTLTPEASWTANTTVLDKDGTGTFVIKMELPETASSLPDSDTEHSVSLSINFEQGK